MEAEQKAAEARAAAEANTAAAASSAGLATTFAASNNTTVNLTDQIKAKAAAAQANTESAVLAKNKIGTQ